MAQNDTIDPQLVLEYMAKALHALRELRRKKTGNVARAYGVTITMMEQAFAYFSIYIVPEIFDDIDAAKKALSGE